MRLGVLLDHFPKILERVRADHSSRRYSYHSAEATVGLCAELHSSMDVETVACGLADFMPHSCPPKLIGPIAFMMLIEHSLRHISRRFVAVDGQSVFAPSISYAAINAQVSLETNVRFFDSVGMDKQPETDPRRDHEIDAVFLAGRTSAIEAYWKSMRWPKIAIIARNLEVGEEGSRIGPESSDLCCLEIDSELHIIEYWSH